MSKKIDDFFKEKKTWSKIKDDLLKCYLKPYFLKILATKKPVFYVDAFAGKGKFDDGTPGSPIIALEIISESMEKTKFKQSNIKSCFIELNYASDLKNNIKKYNNDSNIRIVKGKYEDNISKLLEEKKTYNVFLYIDPYGIKSLYFDLFKNLHDDFYSIELLINLNSFGFIREACRAMEVNFNIDDLDDLIEIKPDLNNNTEKSISDLDKVAGGKYWQEIIEKMKNKIIDGYEAEKQFSEKYCNQLKNQFKYVINMPIRLRNGQRPKYRMIHATNHEDGCILMNDNMCKRWELHQVQTTGCKPLVNVDPENKFINSVEIQKELLEVLPPSKNYMSINKLYAEFISKYGVKCETAKIREELKELERDKKIEVKRKPEFTKQGKKSAFWGETKDKTIDIRRCT